MPEIGCILILALAPSLFAQAPEQARSSEGWVGKRVVPKVAKLTLRVDDEPVLGDVDTHRFFRVEQADGASLLLKPEVEGKGGWAPVGEVISATEALDYFHDQIRKNPKDVFSIAMMGLLRSDRNEHDLAIRSYDDAIRLDTNNAALYVGRARSWFAKKDYDRAIADYDSALSLDRKKTGAFIGRGLSWLATHRSTQAIADFSEAIWLDPLSIQAYLNRGRAWQSKKEYAKAIVDYNMAARLDPQAAAVFRERGTAWNAQRKYRNALADFDEAIRNDPRDPKAYAHRARLLVSCPELALRNTKLAQASAVKSCELTQWQDSDSLDALARASAAIGDFEAAVKWQAKAIALARSIDERNEAEARLKLYLDKRADP